MIGYVDASNEASLKLHEAIGFRQAGYLSGVGYKFGHWTNSVILQRSLGPARRRRPMRAADAGREQIAASCYDRRMIRFAASFASPSSCSSPRPQAAASRNPCQDVEDGGASYTICVFDTRSNSIRLFLGDEKGEVYGSFSALDAALAQKSEKLLFAMNAGMYDERRLPIGLYVEGGHMEKSANTHSGAGNFHMKPNGIFWVEGARAGVTETQRFLKSGCIPPMRRNRGRCCVLGGRVNPRIHESGTSMKIRNGVGVRDGHIVAFAISNQPVTFHAFASLFRERLKCPDALFLDGSISALYAPSISRHDRFRPMGPMVGVVEAGAVTFTPPR